MRKNKSKLMAFSLLALCLACLGFGVYALKNATLTVTGTVGFTAHDCLVNVMAEIEGDGVDTNNVPNSNGAPSEKRDLIINKTENSNEMIVGGATSGDCNKEAEIAETIWFTDLTEDGSVSEIVMTFTLTNQSAYSITASLSNAEIANVRVGASEEITLAAGAEGVLTATFNLDVNANGEYPEINSLPFEVKLDFKKAPAIQAPKNVVLNSETEVLTFTEVDGATSYEVAYFRGETLVSSYEITGSGVTLTNKPGEEGTFNVKIRSIKVENTKTLYSNYVNAGESTREACYHLEFAECSTTGEYGTGAYKVTGIGECKDETVIVPSTYNGYPVVLIADNAFKGILNIKHVTISEGIEIIGQNAFSTCTKLESITLPSTIKTIKNYAFSINLGNLKNVYFNSDLENWYNISFEDFYSNPLNVGANLYCNNQLITNVTIPSSLTSIPRNVFQGCISLKSVVIPQEVKSIGDYAFSSCSSLENVEISEGVEVIGSNAFELCKLLTSLTLPSTLNSLGYAAFSNCRGLKQLKINEGIQTISEYCFNNCSSLEKVEIPAGVKTIKEYAFTNTTLLIDIKLPSTLVTIERNAFDGCGWLKIIEIPEGVQTIGREAFTNTITDIILPTTLTTIGYNAINSVWSRIFYKGTNTDFWNKIYNSNQTINAKIYYYYENENEVPTDGGKYWHYVDGVPTVWEIV